MKKISVALIITLSFFLFTFALPSNAALISPELIKECDKGVENCGLTEMISIIANGMDWILSIIGAITLIMFIYGGFTFLISAGNEENVKKGRDILQGAVVGLIIVFSSYMLISFVLTSMGYDSTGFGQWYNASDQGINPQK